MAEDIKKIAEDLKGKKAKFKSLDGVPEGTKALKLPKDVLDGMKQVFGANLSKVRVHVGGNSAELCKQIKAKAFTSGSNIVVMKPGFAKDSGLLAHELTHVIQQAGGKKMPKEQSGKVLITK